MNVTYELKKSPKELYARSLELSQTNPEEGLTMAINAIELAEQENLFKEAIEIGLTFANVLRKQGDAFGAIERLNHAYRLLNQHVPNDNHLLAELYREFGSVYIDGIKDYAIGIEYFYKCLSLDNPITNEQLYPSMAYACLLYTSPSPRDRQKSRMPSSA